MRPHRKPRKLLRKAFTAFTLLFSAAYVASGWNCIFLDKDPGLAITRGAAIILTHNRDARNQFQFDSAAQIGWGGLAFVPERRMGAAGNSVLELPMWPVVAVLAIANIFWYWHAWRNRPRPGFCRQCGYDLRATPNRCPECGHQPDAARS